MSSLALAHVGDAVYELLVRLYLCAAGRETAPGMHSAAVALVNAGAQARGAARILPELTEEELAVYRRGRNAKVHSVPKNAELGDYHAATGLEALFGYLYLKERTGRLNQLFGRILEGEHAA